MYRSRPGNCPIGGKMLKFLFLCLFSFNAMACLHVQGSYSVDGETWKIDQKMELKQEYSLPMGTFILSLSVTEGKELLVKYKVEEKKGVTLTQVTRGEEKFTLTKAKDIFAKGNEGQPNSILNLKVSKI